MVVAHKKKVKRERGEDWQPTVFFRSNRNRWMVDCGFKLGGEKRLRQMFDTKEEADSWAREKRKLYLESFNARVEEKKQDAKSSTMVRFSGLSERQRGDIAVAMAKANNDSAVVARAVEFYLKHHGAAGTSRKLCHVYREYLNGKRRLGRRVATVKDAHVKLRAFLKAFIRAKVSEITTTDVERWLVGCKFSPITRNSYRAAVVAFFNYCVRRRYIEVNPAQVIELSLMDQTMPGIHTVEEVRCVLTEARDYVPTAEYAVMEWRKGKNGKKEEVPDTGKRTLETDQEKIKAARARIVPYLALGYFAGLRPQNELANLDWKDIDFTDRTIRVDPATAKKRRQRYVDMSDNLVAWLTPYKRKSGKIGFSRFAFRAVRKEADLKWPKDVMRHCFGSYHVALHGDYAKTSAQMGHSRTSELFKSYKNLVKKSAAEEYWKILPEEDQKTTPLPIVHAG
jgi:integrase